MSEGERSHDFADAMVSEVLRAYDRDLIDEAAANGDDITEAATSLRARFLERVAAARARGLGDHGSETVGMGAFDDDTRDCPRSIGRYAVLRRLGSGGMGVVYAAYDELLDRRLAIKVLHEHRWDIDGRRRERLLREAQALARINHPNVVGVHEVGSADDQLFVVMEFVVGPTLGDWLTTEKPTWQEIVAVFRQVADGIAALHDAGLVHRDIKPSNVIVGDDGRVRVLDLGLVAMGVAELIDTYESSAQPSASASASLERVPGSLTMTGERLGTPAYMSREQFLGLDPTPASDIFSFSVALFEALYGMHPFDKRSFHDLRAAIVDGQIIPAPSSSPVPGWLHAVVVRGLAANPEDRPSSMRIMSNALANDDARGRRRTIGMLAFVGVAAALALLAAGTRGPDSLPACDGGEAAIASAWSPDRAAKVHSAIVASDRPYASALAGRITEGLDDYASEWAEAHDRTCVEHARGDHSGALLDARMACLDRRRQAFAQTVEILVEGDAGVVDHAGHMVAGLPRLAACDDLSHLIDHADPPPDSQDASVRDFESRLVRAEALAHAGRLADSTNLAREVATEAEIARQPRLVVRGLLGEARAAILQFDYASSGAALGRALELSIAEGFDALAAEAMILRLYVRGMTPGGSEAALADVSIAEAMLERGGDDPELRTLLLTNTGAIHAAAGDREAAREVFARALEFEQGLYGDEHLEVAVGLGNLGMQTDNPVVRHDLHARMIAIYERRLGPDHPRTLDARFLAAFHTVDPEPASLAFEQLCPRFRTIGENRYAGECELERGRIELARGRFDVARGAFELAREQFDEGDRRALIDAYLALDAEDPRPAIADLRQRIAAVAGGPVDREWWVQIEQAERRALLGRLLVRIGDPAAAVVELEQAIRDIEAIAAQAQPIERERLLATTRTTLAFALVAVGSDDRERIATLVESSRSFYRQWPHAYANRLEELER